MKKIKKIVLIFSFEELNTNVLYNSVLFNLKRSGKNFSYIAYGPKGFHSLFFAADEFREIPTELLNFDNYSEVSEFFPSFKGIRSALKFKCEKFIQKLIISTKPKDAVLLRLLRIIATPRSKKYCTKEILNYIKNDVKAQILDKTESFVDRHETVMFQVQNYVEISSDLQFKVSSFDLTKNYKYLFSEHSKAIENGLTDSWKSRMNKRSLDLSSEVVVLRSRNYIFKQSNSNTKKLQVLPIVQELIESGLKVINVGSPSLELKSDLAVNCEGFISNYSEISNSLTVDEEFDLLTCPVIAIADAGLFTLLACVPVPLITLTGEWSDYLGVSLLNSRHRYGLTSDYIFNPLHSSSEITEHIKKVMK